ncbi:MAG TPA: hypothetical protein VMG59_02860 [Phycisphaerae bacterium]|nr:hypothetical protein [Phycisphaerae bacterium]
MPQRKFLIRYLVYLAIIIVVVSPFAWQRYLVIIRAAAGEKFETAFNNTLALNPRFKGSEALTATNGSETVRGQVQTDADVQPFINAIKKLRTDYPTYSLYAAIQAPNTRAFVYFYPDDDHIPPRTEIVSSTSQPATSRPF